MDVHNRKSPRQNGPRLPKTHGQIRPNSKSQNLCDEVLVSRALLELCHQGNVFPACRRKGFSWPSINLSGTLRRKGAVRKRSQLKFHATRKHESDHKRGVDDLSEAQLLQPLKY